MRTSKSSFQGLEHRDGYFPNYKRHRYGNPTFFFHQLLVLGTNNHQIGGNHASITDETFSHQHNAALGSLQTQEEAK